MKKYLLATVIVAVTGMSMIGSDAYAEGTHGNANLFIGQKTLDEDDWAPLDEQVELGALFDFRGQDWPVNIAVDLLVSADAETVGGVDFTLTTTELNAGIRKHFETGSSFTPYVGGGLALIKAELKGELGSVTTTEDDTGLGFWLNGGLAWTINQINFGLDFRYSEAKADIYGYDAESGGTHVGLFVGYHW